MRAYRWTKHRLADDEGTLDFHLGQEYPPMAPKAHDLEELLEILARVGPRRRRPAPV